MIRVGLTGGLASGKSTVAAFLKELGAAVFDADAIVSDLYGPGAPGAAAARDLFGREALDPRGAVDRARVARLVFTDPERRKQLEERIHPLVRAEIARRFEAAERAGASVAVVEASQLLEAGSEGQHDRVLLVVAPEEERLRRWERAGGSREDARRRMTAQIEPEAARLRADDLLVNDGTPEELRQKVEALYRRWLARETAPRPEGSAPASSRSRGPRDGPARR